MTIFIFTASIGMVTADYVVSVLNRRLPYTQRYFAQALRVSYLFTHYSPEIVTHVILVALEFQFDTALVFFSERPHSKVRESCKYKGLVSRPRLVLMQVFKSCRTVRMLPAIPG